MKRDLHVMYVMEGAYDELSYLGFMFELHENLNAYFQTAKLFFVNCYADEQWVAEIIRERKSYDLVVVNEESAKDVVQAAKENAEFQSKIIVIHKQQQDLRTGKLKKFRNHWSKNVLHLSEGTSFKELTHLLDPRMGYAYQKATIQID